MKTSNRADSPGPRNSCLDLSSRLVEEGGAGRQEPVVNSWASAIAVSYHRPRPGSRFIAGKGAQGCFASAYGQKRRFDLSCEELPRADEPATIIEPRTPYRGAVIGSKYRR